MKRKHFFSLNKQSKDRQRGNTTLQCTLHHRQMSAQGWGVEKPRQRANGSYKKVLQSTEIINNGTLNKNQFVDKARDKYIPTAN